MENLKVKDLLKLCLREYQKGHGDYDVFITDDEEGNGYHAVWFGGQAITEYSADDRAFIESINCDISILKDKDKAVYLG